MAAIVTMIFFMGMERADGCLTKNYCLKIGANPIWRNAFFVCCRRFTFTARFVRSVPDPPLFLFYHSPKRKHPPERRVLSSIKAANGSGILL